MDWPRAIEISLLALIVLELVPTSVLRYLHNKKNKADKKDHGGRLADDPDDVLERIVQMERRTSASHKSEVLATQAGELGNRRMSASRKKEYNVQQNKK